MADGGERWDVFLAHASPDKPRARLLHQALTALGLRVFLDEESLEPGDDWTIEIPRALRSSDVVAVLLSQERGFYDGEELVISIAGQRTGTQRVVPIHLASDVEDPYGTARLNRIEWHDAADIEAVVTRLRRVIPRAIRGETTGASVFCHRIPVPPRHLAGRDDLLARLAAKLGGGRTTTLTQTIQGMGGVGKTTVAAALCEAQRDHHDIVWWVRAEDEGTLVADLAELAGIVGATTGCGGDADAEATVRWLETTELRWLVVYDNVSDRSSVESLLPKRGAGAAILTSRDKRMGSLGAVEPVDLLPDATAEAFLRDRVRGRNGLAADEDLAPVLERAGGLPLALEQAAAWVEQKPNRRFVRWAQLYDDVAEKAFPDGTRPVGYQHTAATAWWVSIDAAAERTPLAPLLLGALGHFAPESIAIQWLRDAAGDPYLDGATADDVDVAIDALDDYHLVAIRADDTLDVHRIVHDIARRTADDAASRFAVNTITMQDPGRHEHSDWPLLLRVSPHARHAAGTLISSGDEGDPRLVYLLSRIANVAYTEGQTRDGFDAATAAVALALTASDPRSSVAAADALARAHLALGDHEEATRMLEEVLNDALDVFGPDHQRTWTHRNNLASAHHYAGDLDRAVTLHRATLADRERVLGPDHPDTLNSRNNLADSLQSAGLIAEAIALHEDNLRRLERAFGHDHIHTLTCRNNLASACRAASDIDRSIALHHDTVAGLVRTVGHLHPATLTTRNNLAIALLMNGDFKSAVPMLEDVVAGRTHVLGPNHADTLASVQDLALARRDAGRAGTRPG
jgi:tetratricopeptide (TPR) repeat protein